MGMLTVVGGPIGNLGDLTPRAAEALKSADFWIVEDSRVSGKLQAHLGVRKPMRVLNDHTPAAKLQAWLDEMDAGASAALLSDAGTPGVSDPGAELVDQCHGRGIDVDATPGPSAVTAALSLSGFYAQRFCFLGFLARKESAMARELAPYADSPMTLVLFEAAPRLEKLLQVCSRELGPRRYAVCREITKRHQQIYRSRLPTLPNKAELPEKGEITLVVEGKRKAHLPE